MAEGIKISELEEVETLQDGCCFPVVSEGTNKKITKKNLMKQLVDDYSDTDEVIIGKWVDGKNLYRKAIEFNNSSVFYNITKVSGTTETYHAEFYVDLSDLHADSIIKFSAGNVVGVCHYKIGNDSRTDNFNIKTKIQVPEYNPDTQKWFITSTSGGGSNFSVRDYSFSSGKLCVEYIKTTDNVEE